MRGILRPDCLYPVLVDPFGIPRNLLSYLSTVSVNIKVSSSFHLSKFSNTKMLSSRGSLWRTYKLTTQTVHERGLSRNFVVAIKEHTLSHTCTPR